MAAQVLGNVKDSCYMSLHKLPENIEEYIQTIHDSCDGRWRTPEQLEYERIGQAKKRFEDIQPVEAYACCAISVRDVLAERILSRIRMNNPSLCPVFDVIDTYIETRSDFGKVPEGFHYSGCDHRPYDYSMMQPEALDDAFKQSRFAHSLTNIHPAHYTEAEKKRLFTVKFAEEALANGDISAPENRAVFWSGGYIPGHELGYGMGRIAAERWLVEKNALIEASPNTKREDLYHTVAMTEAGLPVLNPMWDDPEVPKETKWEVTPVYILGFARTAKGEITLNVDDTDIDSFFRQNEVEVLMSNPNITTVRVVRINSQTDMLEETLYPNLQEWYEAQKDQWVDSIIARYSQAEEMAQHGDHFAKRLLHRLSAAMAEEIYDSYQNTIRDNPLLHFETAEARETSRMREKNRLEQFSPIISRHPEILSHEKISSLSARIALRAMFGADKQAHNVEVTRSAAR